MARYAKDLGVAVRKLEDATITATLDLDLRWEVTIEGGPPENRERIAYRYAQMLNGATEQVLLEGIGPEEGDKQGAVFAAITKEYEFEVVQAAATGTGQTGVEY